MSDVHNLVAEALKSGLSMDDILSDFAKSDNQEEKDWHAKWTSNAASPKYQPGAGIKNDPSDNIWPEEWKRVPNEVPWEGPAAVAAAGIGAWGIKKAAGSETGQKVIRSIKDRFFSPPTPTPDPFAGPVQTPGTALNAPAVAQGAPQPVTAQEGPSAEQIRVAKQRAAQASIEGRPVVSGAGPVTQSVVESTIAPAPAQTPAEMLTNPKPELPAGVTAEQDFGKAPKDMGLVKRSNVNKMSKEATAAEKALVKQGAVIPEGMKPDYPKPKGGVGVGPYHWFENQVGVERAPSLWRELFGEKNVPLKEVQEKYKQFAQSIPEGYTPRSEEGVLLKRGGNFSKTNAVPSYIKGNASLKGMASLAATAGLLGIAGSQKSQEAMERASKAIKDIGISPDIFAGKGEEIGRLGNAYVSAGNPSYQRELLQKIESTNDPEYKKLLQTELQKIGYSGGGRGIAPPSAYQR